MLKLKIPPAVTFVFCIGLIWGVNQHFPNSFLLFEYRTLLSAGLLGIAGLTGVLGIIEFKRKSTTINPHKPENTNQLVTSGIFSISRNPMYLALLLVLLATIFYWGNVFSLIIPAVFIWYMNEFQIKPEEAILEQKFGEQYENYTHSTRRWI